MKQCPQCNRAYSDKTLNFCLDDGEWLTDANAADEPATAILLEPPAVADGFTQSRQDLEARTAYIQPPAYSGGTALSVSTRNTIIAGVFGILLVTAFGVGSYLYYGRSSSKQIESIAVMPFVNQSGNPDVEYLSDGMTETLIRSLSQLPDLNVKARSTVFRYKGKETDAKTVGTELGVQAVLNGRVIQHGEQLSLNLELIDARTENVIWTDQYDRKSSDLVSLQNEIARDVSSKLKLKLSGADQQKLGKNYTTDPEVYRLYLQGRFYWNKRKKSEVAKAVVYFKQAIEKDPNFALGYIGLADSDEDNDRPLKKEYIRRALEIDDNLAEAHASLGYQYMLDYDWTASERELKRAVELNPNYPQAHGWNGARLMMIGKYDESLASIQRGLEIDPTSNGINFYKGVCLAVSGRTDEAIKQFNKLAEMDPAFPWGHSFLSRVYTWTGDHAAAVEERAKSQELDGKPENAKLLRESFASGGWEAFLQESRRQSVGMASLAALSAAGYADREAAIRSLTDKAERGDFWLFLIRSDPIFDSLRGDPRFQDLVKKFDPPQ